MSAESLKLEHIPRSYAKGLGGFPSLKEAAIVGHTTSSVPRPHVVYIVRLVYTDGSTGVVAKRFSQFLSLYSSLRQDTGESTLTFPPRHALMVSLLPHGWIEDTLLDERKAGLNEFLCLILNTEKTRGHPLLSAFFKTPFASCFALESLGEGLTQLAVARPSARRLPFKQDKKANLGGAGTPIVASYYPSWAASTLPLESVDWNKFDVVFFAFAIPNQSGGLDWPDSGKEVLKRLSSVISRRRAQTKVVLSVVHGMNPQCPQHAKEYPNSPGAGNPHSAADAENFLQFLKMLRSKLGPEKIISAAVGHLPWLGSNGKPLNNVSEYAKYMTFVNIMNYDVWPASSHPGPNAPLGDLCHTSSQPEANAKAAYAQWTKAGMPASKLLLGLATYGYVSRSRNTKLSGSSVPALIPGAHPRSQTRLHPAGGAGVDSAEASAPGDLRLMWGQQIAFHQLLSMGALTKKGDGTYGAANGYTMGWDDCSDTPFLFNTQRETVVSYDDTYSLVDKAKFAREVGMAGCFTWSLDQDDGLSLHNAIRSGLGLE
ncbi:hypothetical protein EST38_g8035 [Candolleomyces aberdarensis]|uniref:Uncharacterized protein n=1 Tax=Candolleomyces aberdarensis TaxID=2316362 RepID=A0A4Q2DDN9_9AGAR|nr:hypothetical protein EST38_g8035 [Candolleomyces aberdarensis]